MADQAAQLEACKAAASDYRSQVDTAATKNEALNLAISAAEQLMQALKLTSSPDERKQLKAQCGEMMNVADRIKKTETWIPAKPQSIPSKDAQAGQWAAKSIQTASSSSEVGNAVTRSSSSHRALSPIPTPDAPHQDGSRAKPGNAIHTDHAPAPSVRPSPRPYLSSKISQSASSNAGEAAASSAATSRSQIYRLREPVSSRELSKREEIILLRASTVNGFKCPPWTKDPSAEEFAPNNDGRQFTDVGHLSLSPYQQQFFQAWLRAKEAVPPPSYPRDSRDQVGPSMSSSKPLDLVQDAASDCSVVTSLCAAIARSERGHEQILTNKLYPFDKQRGIPMASSNGKYVVRLNFNGCWRKVIIDDQLPVSSTHRILHVIDSRNPALLWPALLEKAYLKVRGGYDFPGSNSCGDLWALTGWIPEQVFLQETDTVPDQLWKRMYNAFMYGDVLVTAGTGKMSSKQEREFGLEGQHSYAVLDMKEIENDRLLLVKNPWVEGKGWRGPRPPAVAGMDSTASGQDTDDSLASYHRDSIPTQDRPHPTTFWIGLEQVIQHFDSLYLNWNPGLFRYRQDIHFEWDVNKSSPGGCIVNHPQFAFTSKGTGPVWLLLSRHFRDVEQVSKEESDVFNDGTIRPDTQFSSNGDAPKGYMSIYICTGHGERLYMKDTYLESSDYVTTPQCLLRGDMDANTTYTVVIDQDDLAPSKYTFSLSAFANIPITLEPATQRLPLQEIQEGAWTRQTAGGGTDSVKYFDNPQYSLHVQERSSLAILLTSSKHEHPLHVKLAFGHGKRLYRLSSRDVLADSGNHRSGCVLAEIKDLQPGYYTVICSLFEAGLTGDYTLRVDSSSKVALTPIPRDGAGLLSMKLAPACFGAHVHKMAAPLHACRLASYTIIARFLRATSPRAMDLGKLVRSPLRLSVELGRGPERIFLVTSEQGQYTDSATVRSESFNIDPKDVRPGEVWLVLDRLSGPRGPVEEWYDVEIYTDTPKACEIGVWRDWDD